MDAGDAMVEDEDVAMLSLMHVQSASTTPADPASSRAPPSEPTMMNDQALDPNVDDTLEQYFRADEPADEREAGKLEGVTPEDVYRAKLAELHQLKQQNTLVAIDRGELRAGSKIVGTKWVITNKGTTTAPKVKARLVAQEFATDKSLDFFSGTPALAAVKMLLADVTTGPPGRCVLTLDITGAFLYGEMVRDVAVKLPAEWNAGPTEVGRLIKSLYGLRDAPSIWADHMRRTLVSLGFLHSPTVPGIFSHPQRQMKLACHVDDVLATGWPKDLTWLQESLQKVYKLKYDLMGTNYSKEAYFLKRKIEWTPNGIIWTSASTHAELLIQRWARPTVCTLPVAAEASAEPSGQLLPADLAKAFRAGAARVQYLCHDRADLALAAVILATRMAAPRESDLAILSRVGSYLRYRPVMQLHFPFKEHGHPGLQVYTDSDWASCQLTRRSRSGGVLMYRGCVVLHYSRVQDTVALSSGEAELKSTCKGVAEAVGLQELSNFLTGCPTVLEHMGDATAALGILKRHGSGGLKHLSVKQLWLQDVIRRPHNSTIKIPRDLNVADALCSVPRVDTLDKQLARMRYQTPA